MKKQNLTKGNKCDECKTKLEKTFIMTKYNLPLVAWVCPKSEIYQLYQKEFTKEYHKNLK